MEEETQEILSRLVHYWAECLREEDIQEVGVSPRARTRALIAPFPADPFVFADEHDSLVSVQSSDLKDFVRAAALSSEELVYGYPVVRYEDADTERLLPLFTVRLEVVRDGGSYYLRPIEWPLLGVGACERLGLRSEEVADLAGQVEPLFDAEATVEETAEGVLAALEQVFGNQIHGSLDPWQLLTKRELARATEFGVYNGCIVFKAETSAFNRALLDDLSLLQGRSDLVRSALRLLVEDGASRQGGLAVPVLPFRFDEHQLAAMQTVLSNDLTVVTGPPGTGKSELVANLLVNLLMADKSVLLVSNTNEAVNVVHERLEGLFPGAILRTGNKEARQSLRSQLDAASSRMGGSSKPFRREELSSRWQRIRQLRDRLQRLHEMNLELESLDQDLTREANALGLSAEICARASTGSVPSGRLEALVERWRVLDMKARGIRLSFLDRLLAKPFPGRLRRRAATAESVVFASMGPGTSILLPDRDLRLNSPPVGDVVADFIRLLRIYERLAELMTLLKACPGRIELEKQILAAQDAFRDTSRALVGESYLARLRGSPPGVLRTAINRITQRRSGYDAPPPAQVLSLLSGLPLWASTLKSLRSTFPLDRGMFDYVVFDEASQVDLPSAAPALYRAKRVVVIGDPMQLSHVASTTRERDRAVADKFGIGQADWLYPDRVRYCDVSLYYAAERVPNAAPILLRQHYRSRDSIAMLCNDVFYDGRLEIRTDLSGRQLPAGVIEGVHWHDIQGVSLKHPAGSRYNVAEADFAANLVRNLVDSARGTPLSIGVVTPFSRQAQILQAKLLAVLTDKERELHSIKVLTAHKFQGREADVVIASLVVAAAGDGGNDRWFNIYPQILNVALSRARDSLHIVADRRHALAHGCRPDCVLTRLASGMRTRALMQPAAYFDTPFERALWAGLSKAGLESYGYVLHTQLVVERYTLDLALAGPVKLNIECDGSQHETVGGMPVLADVARDQFLTSRGWIVLRYANHRIRSDLAGVVADILRHAVPAGAE